MLTKDGPKMIEVGARMGGDNITSHLVPLSTGIDMVKATIELSIGNIPDLTAKFEKGSAIRYIDFSIDIISASHENILNISGVKELVVNKKYASTKTTILSSADRVGYVISQSDDTNNAIEICNNAIVKLKNTIDN